MTHPDLESARLKLDRAREHIEGLKAEHSRFFKYNPQPFSFGFQDDPQQNRILGIVTDIIDPNPFFSTILGDAIQNLRACLDHIAWQLYKHGTTPNLSREDEQKIQFPFCRTLPEFEPTLDERIPGIGDVEKTIVSRYQPSTRGDDSANHPFARLNTLSRRDKHRNIHVTFWCSDRAAFRLKHVPNGCRAGEIVPLIDLNDPLQIDTELFAVSVDGPLNACLGMEVETKVRLGEAFEDGRWVHNSVSEMERLATDLLSELDRVF